MTCCLFLKQVFIKLNYQLNIKGYKCVKQPIYKYIKKIKKGVWICFKIRNTGDKRIKKNLNANDAKNLLRLESQFKNIKTNGIKVKEAFDTSNVRYFIAEELSNKHIWYYYNRTIGDVDYYKTSDAIKIIKGSDESNLIKKKLINVIKEVSLNRSV